MTEIVPFDPAGRRKRRGGRGRGARKRWLRPEAYVPGARRGTGKGKAWSAAMVLLPLATFGAVFLFGLPALEAQPFAGAGHAAADREEARFELCGSGVRVNCVVDGDTFWYAGEKIRVADINTPEVSEPQCAREAELGARATGRMRALLNAGAFTLEPVDRDRDRYGRLLRTVTRDGESLGEVLVSEGLAEVWRGRRGSWC